jgi:hypothetical protein
MNLNEYLEELSATALPPVTASRPRTRPVELSARPAWFEADALQSTSQSTLPDAPAAGPSTTSRPAQDEWGMFDPDQCGAQALFEKLDAAAENAKSE